MYAIQIKNGKSYTSIDSFKVLWTGLDAFTAAKRYTAEKGAVLRFVELLKGGRVRVIRKAVAEQHSVAELFVARFGTTRVGNARGSSLAGKFSIRK